MPNEVTDQPEPLPANFIVEKMHEVKTLSLSMDEAQKKFVKDLINPDLTDTELVMFLQFSNNLKLNPFTKEIIAVVYGSGEYRKVNTIITRDGKRVVATRTGELEGIESEPIYIKETVTKEMIPVEARVDSKPESMWLERKEIKKVQAWEGGRLWGATATVIRNDHNFSVTIPFSEYNSGKNVWATKPETMIKKVAESQALSKAFPEILGGVYDDSEVSVEVKSDKDILADKVKTAQLKYKEEKDAELPISE